MTAEHVGVVSLGLIGGSIALRLAEHGHRVSAWNPSPAALEQAAAHGIEGVGSIAELCALAPEVLVLANPLRAMESVVREVAASLRPGTVVMDVGSVKAPVGDLVRRAGLGPRFVGAHPMAGTEQAGFAAADPAILDGARWALAIDDETTAAGFLRAAELVAGPLGGTIHPVDPQMHDEAVALISHVPHVLATELLDLVGRAPARDLALSLAAGSFRDGTRVAGTNPRRTEAMVVENTAWVAPALRVVARDLVLLAERLESNGPVADFFDEAAGVRRSREPGGEGAGELERLALGEDWRALVLAAGARGAVVTGADAAAGELVLRTRA